MKVVPVGHPAVSAVRVPRRFTVPLTVTEPAGVAAAVGCAAVVVGWGWSPGGGPGRGRSCGRSGRRCRGRRPGSCRVRAAPRWRRGAECRRAGVRRARCGRGLVRADGLGAVAARHRRRARTSRRRRRRRRRRVQRCGGVWSGSCGGAWVPLVVVGVVMCPHMRGVGPSRSDVDQVTGRSRLRAGRQCCSAARTRASRKALVTGESALDRRCAVKMVRRAGSGSSSSRHRVERPAQTRSGMSPTALPDSISRICACRSAVS